MKPQTLAKIAHACSGIIQLLPKHWVVRVYSGGRLNFMQRYIDSKTRQPYIADKKWQRILWGLNFPLPLMNSAGMFKNGDGYDVVAPMGAGGYIGGTSTYNPRDGNLINGIKLPFITLPQSNTSINCLGLPNLGDRNLSIKNITQNKVCPLGWSLMRSPDYDEDKGLENLIKSLWMYHDNLKVDFVEINESCPNVKVKGDNIIKRLEYIAKNFLGQRKRHLPVIIKLSNDITIPPLHNILDTLFKFKYDGINLGNTSTDYAKTRMRIAKSEVKLFDYFTHKFGGGIGGTPLKTRSFYLCHEAVKYRDRIKPGYEFHIIRSGGIDSIADIHDSDSIGVSLNQWYTGYFSNYIKYGSDVYKYFFQ